MSADVAGRCPACGWESLFLGAGGHVTCRIAECPNPCAADDVLHGVHAVAVGLSAVFAPAFMRAIGEERVRAHEKHGPTSMEQAPLLHHRRASILVEEAVECMRALNDHERGDVNLITGYIGEGGTHVPDRAGQMDELDKELIQTAAMAYTWWANRRGDTLAPLEPVQPPSAKMIRECAAILDTAPYQRHATAEWLRKIAYLQEGGVRDLALHPEGDQA